VRERGYTAVGNGAARNGRRGAELTNVLEKRSNKPSGQGKQVGTGGHNKEETGGTPWRRPRYTWCAEPYDARGKIKQGGKLSAGSKLEGVVYQNQEKTKVVEWELGGKCRTRNKRKTGRLDETILGPAPFKVS